MNSYDENEVMHHVLASRVDALTNLPTYTEFREEAEAYINEFDSEDDSFALVATNLVNFRAYNRLHGFEAGDEFLRKIAKVFAEAFEGCPVMRYAEDHFYALIHGIDFDERVTMVNNAVNKLSGDAGIRFKSGVYYLDPKHDNLSNALDKARAACDSIRDNFEAYCCVYNESLLLSQHILDHVDEAIEKHWIEVWMQPILRVGTSCVCGLEALARWNDPQFGLISPAVFVPLLEQHGLISKIDRCVVTTLGHMYQGMVRSGRTPLPISINFSRIDFESFDVLELLNKTCSEFGIPHDMIQVEVTESTLAQNADLMHRQINAIHDAGYKVWLDDFGSGYSTFTTMLDFKFDLIKLDMDFLRRYTPGSKVGVIITALIDMAKQLGIQTLAEGVETPEQFMFLKKIGCEKAQGFLFSKPLPPQALMEKRAQSAQGSESRSNAAYYDEVDRVNIIGRGLISFEDDGTPISVGIPMAILEMKDGVFNYLASNAAYDEYIHEIGFNSLQAAADNLSNPIYASGGALRDAAYKARESGESIIVDHVDNAMRCTSTMRFISEDPTTGTSAYLISSLNLTRFNRLEISDLQEAVMSNLLDMYDRIDIGSTDGTFVRNIFHKAVGNEKSIVEGSLAETLQAYCMSNLYEEDWQAFAELYDLNTIEERLAASHGKTVGAYLRTRHPELGWVRKLYTISSMNANGERMYLSCMHDADPVQFEESANVSGAVRTNELWSSMLDLEDIAVFWKDSHRRYLGCNQAFLDYYNLGSSRNIIGKTSEEMGWLVNPIALRKSEEMILSGDLVVENELEYTIVGGTIHQVIITRVPVRDSNGEIIGIMGLFIDVDKEKSDGMLVAKKMQEVLSLYLNAYENQGHNFTVCALQLNYPEDYQRLYGDEFKERMHATMASAISFELANGGVCCECGDDIFLVVHQTECGDVEHCGICRAIRAIKEISGIPCEMNFRSVFATIAECGSLEGIREKLVSKLGLPEDTDIFEGIFEG